SLVSDPPAKGLVRARVGGASTLGASGIPLSPRQKFRFSFFKKSSGLYLYSRTEVSGTAHPLYAAVATARENFDSSEPDLVWAPLYDFARTHFAQNTTP
ncbi:MAG: hypothetical protein NUV98_01610, partial [Candidatus Roizmanbacteria bacterium]|nr:hypothetical protein [Candidatus Roizmanbacteria bacterium]